MMCTRTRMFSVLVLSIFLIHLTGGLALAELSTIEIQASPPQVEGAPLLTDSPAPAAPAPPAPPPTKQDIAVDTIWVVVAAVLVMLMQAGFAMLECGFSRAKNAGHTAMKNLLVFAVASLAFWAVGFGICFGTGNALIGMSGWFLDVAADKINEVFASLSFSSVPLGAKYLFQVVFCAVSLAIVWGGMAERTKLIVYLVFGAIFSALIYPVVGHWIWGGGWLSGLGMQDFAGSTVVHLQGASAALAGAILLGPRIGKYTKDGKPNAILGHNMPLVILGTIILWFGWFGFNPGSTLSALSPEPGYFAYVALTTNLAAAAGVLAGLLIAWWVIGNPDMTMAANGALAALVAITASCAFVDPWAAVVIGAGAGTIAVLGVLIIERLKIDDPVGAVSVHGMAGIWGTLANGLFATPERVKLLAVGQPGLFYGGGLHQLFVQAVGVAAAFAYVFVASLIVFTALKLTIGLRVSAEDEIEGLDMSEHGILGYPEQSHRLPAGVPVRTAPLNV
jgi:Amt family ammonium transporter